MSPPLRPIPLFLLILGLIVALPRSGVAQDGWPGDWQTYWSVGEAFVLLEQRGETVYGTYQPGDGRVTGITQDGVLRGTWQEADESGSFIFVLAQDGQSFAGRFGSGDWWNGHRAGIAQQQRPDWWSGATPQAKLRSILAAGNDAQYHGREGQVRWIEPLLSYDGPEGDSSDRDRRRRTLWHILDISTFRLWDAPVPPPEAEPGTELTYDIGPAGAGATYQLVFRLDDTNLWQLVLPPGPNLQADLARLIAARGYKTLDELEKARAGSPRMVMMDFILGTADWDGAGGARALRALDLDHVPRQLRRAEGALMADYLKRTIDRIGYVYWQEIPDDPARPLPYTFYRHPLGKIIIAPTDIKDEDGRLVERLWRFSRDTMEALPALYEALERMPIAPGLTAPPPLSQYFATRRAVLARADGLQRRVLGLELWQWIGLAAYLLAMSGVLALARRAARALGSGRGPMAAHLAQMGAPAGLLMAALLFLDASERLGLTLRAFGPVSALSAILLIFAVAALAYRAVSLVHGALMVRAVQTSAYTDEIVLSLAQGLLKLLVVIGAVIACADVAGLPYEGVLTGLGIGGVAVAFAARETVANIIGGAILLSDRPFRKGDMIEAAGTLAVIETVGLRSTRLRTMDNTLMIMPNAQLSDQVITNWDNRQRRKVQMLIGLTFDTPRDRLERFVARLMEVYCHQPDADTEDVTIGVVSLGPQSVDIELWGHFKVVTYEAQVAAQQALILDILSLAKEMHVSFAFPTRTVHLAAAPPATGQEDVPA
ncbi:mechanosensitive ion channel family protein [Antarctobacter heliothermus]|uniref:Small-conductance mechanosensitive channel n=1 Tax=Antarctobacter heliothermus TaxID=74033 RepID=A0A239B2Y7_9RHOB|nr:mechanosensitive ion channel family protein [Antarctobacter heliothermus]SNS02169.1 Small-conductance mechanosensitive channel [Antarctobacter heliothermus]